VRSSVSQAIKTKQWGRQMQMSKGRGSLPEVNPEEYVSRPDLPTNVLTLLADFAPAPRPRSGSNGTLATMAEAARELQECNVSRL
jgi:hypothetical protein